MTDTTTRTMEGVGWLLVVAAALALVGFIGYGMFFSENESPVIAWVVGVLYLGFAILFLSVLRQRIKDRKSDKYKDVEI